MAAAAGAEVCKYGFAVTDNSFAPDIHFVRNKLKQKSPPQLLVLNSPHNPTGHAFDEQELIDLLALASEAGTRVLVDEVFSGIRIEAPGIAKSAIVLDKKAIVIGCLSKVYGLAGLRIGWLVGSKEFIQQCIELRYYTVLVPPSIVQQLGKIAVEKKTEIIARTQKNVDENYKYVQTWLESRAHLLDWFRPQAGLVMLLRLKEDVNTAQFAGSLAEKCKVFLVPCSSCFDMPKGFLRLGLGGSPTKFRSGLDLLGSYLETKRGS
jgi:aspartate/methionine/tyrosine aminotransferase